MSGDSVDRRRRADALFEELGELPEELRARRLAELDSSEPEVGALVARLLAAVDEPVEALDSASAAAREVSAGTGLFADEADEPSTLRQGDRLGAWKVVAPIGRGGMSRVFLAERTAGGFHQRAALKLFYAPEGSRNDLARRFEQERQILAALEHPNIARVLDGGLSDDGRPYLVLELVDGVPIDTWCERRSLPLRERVALIVAVARAVQHAHRNLIVHRDLKPSNLLVSGDGVVKLLDFGIAKVLEGSSAFAGMPLAFPETRTSARPLTPAYASPEQVRGQPVTTASDIYQLGLLLYELLAGRPAHLFREDSWRELERVVCEAEPPRLGKTLDPDPERARATPREAIPSDLETIVLKALQKDPARRYASAEQLAEDLERFLDDRPVLARPDSAVYRAGKFVRRHRGSVAATAVAIAVLLTGAVLLALQARRLADERDRARREARRAETVATFLAGLFESSDPESNPGATLSARDLLDRGAERLDAELASEPTLLAEMLAQIGDLNLRLGRAETAERLARRALAVLPAGGGDRVGETKALYVLGWALNDLGRYEESLAPLELAYRIRLGFEPTPEADLARVLTVRGDSLRRLERFETADAALREASERLERDPNVGVETLANSFLSRSELHFELGDLAEAERLSRHALGLLTAAHGADSPRLAWGLNGLGRVLEARGDLAGARSSFELSLARKRQLYAGDHPSIAVALHNLARLVAVLGDMDGAVRYGEQALAMREKLLGPEHVDTAVTRMNLGIHERERGHPGRAAELLEHAERDLRAGLGDRSRLGLVARVWIGLNQLDQGESADASRSAAEALLELAAAARDRPAAELLLGRIAESRGDLEAATSHFERSFEAQSAAGNPAGRTGLEARLRAVRLRSRSPTETGLAAESAAAVAALEPLTPRLRRLVESP